MRSRMIKMLVPCALLAASTAWGQLDPYAVAPGVQWTFLNGTSSADNPVGVGASPDGSVWITTMGAGNGITGTTLTWGSDKSIYGGAYASGYGQISAYGQILQGNDLPNIPNWDGTKTQSYFGGITITGTTANLSWNPNKDTAYWTGQQTTGNLMNPMTVSIAPVSTPQGAPYPNAAGLSNQWNVPLLSNGGAGSGDSTVDSSGNWYFAGATQTGDVFTAGDFGTSGTGTGYRPYIGSVAPDGTTLSGPMYQPDGDATRDYWFDIDHNNTSGQTFAVGYSYQGVPTFWDPDGAGPLPAHNYSNAAGIGTGVLYDSSWNPVAAVVWDTNNAGEGIYDVTATPDGGWMLVGQTTGNLKAGANNPSIGTRDAYIAKYDATGTLVWDYQSQTAYWDYAGDVTVDADGNVYVSGSQDLGGGDNDGLLMKFSPTGTLLWTAVIDNAGSQDAVVDHGNVDKDAFYVLAENNPSIGGVWTSTTGYTPQGTDENLLVKLTPGDVNTDGYVDLADLNAVGLDVLDGTGTNTQVADFNGNSQIDKPDLDYFVENVFDTNYGDGNFDGSLDVDDADQITKAAYNADPYNAMLDMDGDGGNTDTADVNQWLIDAATVNGVPNAYALGDTDLNGLVDIADLQTLAGGFGSAGTYAMGDFDGDGTITIADLQLLAGNFGYNALAPASPIGISLGDALELANIPEPTSMVLFGLAGLGLIRRRRGA